MSLTAIEQSILGRLAPLRQVGLLVRALPNSPGEYGEIQGNGVLTVSWSLDDVRVPASMGKLQQECLMEWVIDGRVRNLRDAAGLQSLRTAIYSLLIGFQPPHCRKMYAKRFEFVGRTEAIWNFQATFVVPTTLIEVVTIENLPLLLEMTFEIVEINNIPVENESVDVP